MTAGVIGVVRFYNYGTALISTVSRNPEVFVLEEDIQYVLAQFYNIIIWMLVPYLLGMMGAAARELPARFKRKDSKKLTVFVAWYRSKVFLAVVACVSSTRSRLSQKMGEHRRAY